MRVKILYEICETRPYLSPVPWWQPIQQPRRNLMRTWCFSSVPGRKWSRETLSWFFDLSLWLLLSSAILLSPAPAVFPWWRHPPNVAVFWPSPLHISFAKQLPIHTASASPSLNILLSGFNVNFLQIPLLSLKDIRQWTKLASLSFCFTFCVRYTVDSQQTWVVRLTCAQSINLRGMEW